MYVLQDAEIERLQDELDTSQQKVKDLRKSLKSLKNQLQESNGDKVRRLPVFLCLRIQLLMRRY